jgi:uncharacterized protein (TIGR00266 family)
MAITITCGCGKQLLVPDELLGKAVKCPACQRVVTAPARAELAAEPAFEVEAAPSAALRRPDRAGRPTPVRSHDIGYEIIGDDLQLVEIELDPGEVVIAEAGALTYMEDDIRFAAKMGDGSEPDQGLVGKLFSAGKRVLIGESIFMTHFTNTGAGKRHVAFGAPYPGKILAINLSEVGGQLICQKEGFLCAALGTKLGIAFQKRLGAGFFGGEGFILQRLEGDGLAFVHACGAIIERRLSGETLRVDTGCVVAFTSGIDYSIERAGNLKSMLFGGEGLFLVTMSGTGTVWLQSLPFSRLADRILAHAPRAGGTASEEGSVLGGLGRMLSGD